MTFNGLLTLNSVLRRYVYSSEAGDAEIAGLDIAGLDNDGLVWQGWTLQDSTEH